MVLGRWLGCRVVKVVGIGLERWFGKRTGRLFCWRLGSRLVVGWVGGWQ